MTATQTKPEDRRRRRAECLDQLFTEERWTSRKVATRLGLSHTYVGRRRAGENDVSFEDIEMFADVLKMSGEDLYRLLKAAEEAPEPIRAVGGGTTFLPADRAPGARIAGNLLAKQALYQLS